jgi:hypothetical protein
LRASKLGISKASIAREKERKKQRRGASDSLNQIFNKKKRKTDYLPGIAATNQ